MIAIGDHFYDQSITSFKEANPRIFENSYGYDAQFYAQIALDPSLQDPQLPSAIDNLPYRSRRILMPATAWLLGTGNPDRIINVFPLINPLCWLISAIILLHWLPPIGFQNALRWSGILLGWGWITSVERSLTDGPAATLTLLAALLISKGAATGGALAIAASALTKDASLVTGLGLCLKEDSPRKSTTMFITRGFICILPIALWWTYVSMQTPVHENSALGSGNFSMPFFDFFRHVQSILQTYTAQPSLRLLFALACYAAILIQILTLILRPRPKDLWWRLGIGTAVLGSLLGIAVWEDIPGAAPRVLLVLHIAFNIVTPYSKRWLPLLILGNVSIIDFPRIMQPPELSQYSLDCIESKNFIYTDDSIDSSTLILKLEEGWHTIESTKKEAFVWSKDEGRIEIQNNSATTRQVSLTLKIGTHYPRNCRVFWNDTEIGNFEQALRIEEYTTKAALLQPGKNVLRLSSDYPAKQPNEEDQRKLGLSFYSVTFKKGAPSQEILSFEDPADTAKLHYSFDNGWYEKESSGKYIWRWAKETATIRIENTGGTTLQTIAKLQLRSISSSELTLTCNGTTISINTIGDSLTQIETQPFVLPPGSNSITLHSKTKERDPTTDSRLLNVALYELKFQITKPIQSDQPK